MFHMHSFNAGLMKWLTRLEKSRSRMKVGQTNEDTRTHPRSQLSSRLPRLGLPVLYSSVVRIRRVHEMCIVQYFRISLGSESTLRQTPENVPSRGQRVINHLKAPGRGRLNGAPQLKSLYVVSDSELGGHHSIVYATFSR